MEDLDWLWYVPITFTYIHLYTLAYNRESGITVMKKTMIITNFAVQMFAFFVTLLHWLN
jgi:hypothetical protein